MPQELEAIQTQVSQHLVRRCLPLLQHIHTPQVMYSQNMQAQRGEVPPMDHCSSQCLAYGAPSCSWCPLPVCRQMTASALCGFKPAHDCLPYRFQTCLDSPHNHSLSLPEKGSLVLSVKVVKACVGWDSGSRFWTALYIPSAPSTPLFSFISTKNASLALT